MTNFLLYPCLICRATDLLHLPRGRSDNFGNYRARCPDCNIDQHLFLDTARQVINAYILVSIGGRYIIDIDLLYTSSPHNEYSKLSNFVVKAVHFYQPWTLTDGETSEITVPWTIPPSPEQLQALRERQEKLLPFL